METVSITSKSDIQLEDVRASLAPNFRLLSAGPDCVVAEEHNTRVYIHHPKRDSGVAITNELFLDYSSVDLVKKVIQVIADNADWTEDVDFGVVMPGDQLVVRIKAEKEWDWRAEFIAQKEKGGE